MTTTTSEPAVPGRPRGWRPWARWGVQLGLTALVTWFVLDRVGVQWADFARIDLGRWQPSALPLVGSVAMMGAGYVLSGWLWARMVREMGGPQLPLLTAVRVYMVANLGRYVPGKVLQIAGLAWLARREGVSPAVATAAAVVGQGMALLGATLVGLGAFFGPNQSYRIVGWCGLGVTALVVVATSIPRSARVLERLWRRLADRAARGRARSLAPDSAEQPGVSPVFTDPAARPGFGLRWTAWYALNWAIYAAAFWLLFLGLEGWAPFLQVGPAFAAAYLVGYLVVFAPAGAGIRESAMVVFLLPVLPGEAALALAVAARIWATLIEVVPAAVLAAFPSPRASTSRSPNA